MRRILAAAVAAGVAVTPAAATPEKFFQRQVGTWAVWGDYDDAGCYAQFRTPKGSAFTVSQYVVDTHMINVGVMNVDWEIDAPVESTLTGRINLFRGDRQIDGGDVRMTVISKNLIIIPALNKMTTFFTLQRATVLTLIMPHGIRNINIPLAGSAEALDALNVCVAIGRKQGLKGA